MSAILIESLTQKTGQRSEEGGRPISTIKVMLVIVLNQLVTMVTFICRFALLFPRTDHPPLKSSQWGGQRSDFDSTSAVNISPV